LLLFTAQRRSDVVKMGRQHIRNGVVHVRQQKTGAQLAIPVHPDLQAIVEATPSEHLTFLVTAYGKPFTAAGFGGWFRERCDEASLPKHCAAHGLRMRDHKQKLAQYEFEERVERERSERERYEKAMAEKRASQTGLRGTKTGNGDRDAG
jgi:hypothetical protein